MGVTPYRPSATRSRLRRRVAAGSSSRSARTRGLSGASLAGRNDLVRAVHLIESGQADALLATKVDRVSRSVADFAGIIKRAREKDWTLVVMDLGLDLSTSTGKFVAHIMSAVAELERDMISDRTKAGLAAARARGVSSAPRSPSRTRWPSGSSGSARRVPR